MLSSFVDFTIENYLPTKDNFNKYTIETHEPIVLGIKKSLLKLKLESNKRNIYLCIKNCQKYIDN